MGQSSERFPFICTNCGSALIIDIDAKCLKCRDCEYTTELHEIIVYENMESPEIRIQNLSEEQRKMIEELKAAIQKERISKREI